MQDKAKLFTRNVLAIGNVALLLVGCGGGLAEPSPPPVNASLYESMASYCGETLSSATDPGGYGNLSHAKTAGNLSYNVSSLISASGINSTELSVSLYVPVNDYRGVTGTFVPAGYGQPGWIKGVSYPELLGAKSIACVVDLPKVLTTTTYTPPNLTPSSAYSLSWQSYWTNPAPISQLPGYHVDGFELVSNFSPTNGQIFFNVDKTTFPSTQTLSICFLPPSGGQWQCSTPTVSDITSAWSVHISGAVNPGMYVLVSSVLN